MQSIEILLQRLLSQGSQQELPVPLMLNNLDWFGTMPLLTFLRQVFTECQHLHAVCAVSVAFLACDIAVPDWLQGEAVCRWQSFMLETCILVIAISVNWLKSAIICLLVIGASISE